MSLKATSWALYEAPKDLDAGAFRVLMIMSDKVGDDGVGYFESLQRLADKSGLSKRTVQSKLSDLLDRGVIRRGDQRVAAYLPANRRPVVYDLAMEDRVADSATQDAAVDDPPAVSTGHSVASMSATQTRPEPDTSDDARVAAAWQQGGNRVASMSATKTIKTLKTLKPRETRARGKSIFKPIGDFTPDGTLRALAKTLHLDADLEFDKFRDSALAEARTSADWAASFRNWLRRGHELGLDKIAPAKPTPIPEHHQTAPHRHTVGCEHVLTLIGPVEWRLSSDNQDGFGTSPLLKAKQALADKLNEGIEPTQALADLGLSNVDELEDVA